MRAPRRLHVLLALLVAGAAALAAVGCGGGDDPDPTATLDKALSTETLSQLGSGNLNFEGSFGISNGGDPAQVGKLTVTGPFGEGGTANFTATASGVDPRTGKPLTFDGGLTVTQDNLYITYKGTPYELGTERFRQLKATALSAPIPKDGSLKQQFSETCKAGLTQTGGDTTVCDQIDPAGWADLDFSGNEDVNGTDTDHFSGNIDTNKAFEDILKLIPAGSIGVPSSLLEQVPNFIDNAEVGVYVGKDDSLIRKGDFKLSANLLGTEMSLDSTFDVSDVNEPQTISAPTGAQPIEKLREQLPPGSQNALDCFLGAKSAADIAKCGAAYGASAGAGAIGIGSGAGGLAL